MSGMQGIFAFRFESLSFTELLFLLVGGGILVILLVAVISIIVRRGKNPPGNS
jgi:hypothetical protein